MILNKCIYAFKLLTRFPLRRNFSALWYVCLWIISAARNRFSACGFSKLWPSSYKEENVKVLRFLLAFFLYLEMFNLLGAVQTPGKRHWNNKVSFLGTYRDLHLNSKLIVEWLMTWNIKRFYSFYHVFLGLRKWLKAVRRVWKSWSWLSRGVCLLLNIILRRSYFA